MDDDNIIKFERRKTTQNPRSGQCNAAEGTDLAGGDSGVDRGLGILPVYRAAELYMRSAGGMRELIVSPVLHVATSCCHFQAAQPLLQFPSSMGWTPALRGCATTPITIVRSYWKPLWHGRVVPLSLVKDRPAPNILTSAALS